MDALPLMRERILDAALACMRETGVRGATTKAIARHAGVAEGSIYNHFANRSELIVAAFRRATQGVREHAVGLRERVGEETVETNLVRLMEEAIEFLGEILPVAGSVMGDPSLREWFSAQESTGDGDAVTPLLGVVEIARYLEAEAQRGRIPVRESWVPAAAMLSGACLQYAYAGHLSPSGIGGMLPADASSPRDYARAVVGSLFEFPASS